MKQQYTTIQDITPAIAKEYLAKSNGNRGRYGKGVYQSKVDQYARDMRNGNWVLTHQGIAFDCDGYLIDGYNRLTAIVQSGATAQMTVTHNSGDQAIKYLDSGKLRTNSDKLQLPKRHAESLRFSAKHAYKTNPPSISDMEKIMATEYYKNMIDILSIAKTAVKVITSSPFICGVAFCASRYSKQYAEDQYGYVYHQNYENMTPVVSSFVKRINRNEFSATNHDELFARCITVFNPENRYKVKGININDRLARTMFNDFFKQ